MRNLTSILYFLIVLISINTIISFADFTLDITDDKRYSVSDEAKNILKNLDDIIFIKIYLNGEFPDEFKHLQTELENLLKIFKSIGGNNFQFEFIDPNNVSNEEEKIQLFKQLVKNGLTPTDIEIKLSSSKSQQIIFPGAIIYYRNKQHALNFLKNSITKKPGENINESIENLEYEFISGIYHITNNTKHKIAFLEGNGELKNRELYDLNESVLQDNNKLSYHYNVDRFNIKKFEANANNNDADILRQIELMSKYKVIVIAKPTIPFNKLDKYLIDQYIMNGGKVLWLIDGVSAKTDSLQKNNFFIAGSNNLNLDDQLFKYGLRINSNLIEDLRSTKIPIVTGFSNNIPQQSLFAWPYYPLLFSKSNHSISKNLDAIKCEYVSSIDTIKNNIKKTILLSSSTQSRISPAPVKISLNIIQAPPPLESYNKSNIPIAVLLEGEFESVFKNRILPKNNKITFKEKSKNTQMIVISDGDLIRNDYSKDGTVYPLGYDRYIRYTYPGNKKFILNCIHYLCDDIGLTELKSKEIKLRLLDKTKITNNKILIKFVNILLPLFLLLIFTLLVIRYKKNKYAFK